MNPDLLYRVSGPDAAWGTLWPIAPGIGVTAAHVVEGLEGALDVHRPGVSSKARVRALEPEYDVAMVDLQLRDAPTARCHRPEHGAPARIDGWPAFAEEAPACLQGHLSQTVDGSCVLQVADTSLQDRSWAGLSGAPVWSNDGVVGIATHVHPGRSLVRVCTVEHFNELLPPHLQPLPPSPMSDPRRAQLAEARNELLRGSRHRGLAYVGAAGFEARRFGRALATELAHHAHACLVIPSGSLGGSQPSVAARLLRALSTRLADTPHAVVRSRGSDAVNVQLTLDALTDHLSREGRRLVLYLQGLTHLSTDEAVLLGNVLAGACQHRCFRLLATGGRRLRELQAMEFEQHSAFHEVSYPTLMGLKTHQCDRLTDGLGLPDGWMWPVTEGHPALSRELAELLHRGCAPDGAADELLLHSDFLAATRMRIQRTPALREACGHLARAGGSLRGHGFDPHLDELQFLGLARRTVDAWEWTAPFLQRWSHWSGLG
ncbi:MAG: serine protease [Myxococcales bacterium]|nr:serine protease [Myxococcales bacterium]